MPGGDAGVTALRERLRRRAIRVAASDCLLGNRVRWDGDHNADAWPGERLGRVFSLVGLCPEVGIGLGVPRPPIRLVADPAAPRAVAVHDPEIDYTSRLASWHASVGDVLADVSGYVFADRSPSCGLAGVKVHDANGSFRPEGRGIHAAAVADAWPALPMADAETLLGQDALTSFAVAVVRHALAPDPPGEGVVKEALRPLL